MKWVEIVTKQSALRILGNIYLLSGVLGCIVILFLPPVFNRYTGKLVNQEYIDKAGGIVLFDDLNGDGCSEKTILFNNTQKQATLKIINQNGLIVCLQELEGIMLPRACKPQAGDYDHTGRKRLFAFSLLGDSVLLHIVDPFEKKRVVRSKFVTTVHRQKGVYDFNDNEMCFADLNQDGIDEVLFGIMAGYSLTPRKIFAYDIVQDSLWSTVDLGCIASINDIADINNDSVPEILCNAYAIGNHDDSSDHPFPDSCAWLFVLDRNLKFSFQPIPFCGVYTNIMVKSLPVEDQKKILILKTNRNKKNTSTSLELFDQKGLFLKSATIPGSTNMNRNYYWISGTDHDDNILTVADSGKVYRYNHALELQDSVSVIKSSRGRFYGQDIDLDGNSEYILIGEDGFAVYRKGFLSPVLYSCYPGITNEMMSFKYIDNQLFSINLQVGNIIYAYSYGKNSLYYYKWLIYAGIFLVIFLILKWIQYSQRILIQQKLRMESKITGMQLLLLQNQLDPHFTLNAMNSIGAVIRKKHPEEAYDYMTSFSRLIRSSLMSAGEITRTIGEEIDFVQNYLILEQLRMNNRFRFEIEVDESIDQKILIPKMLIQIFAENAVKHGLSPLAADGLLAIRIHPCKQDLIESKSTTKFPDSLCITIIDNGIGRKASTGQSTVSTGKGISTLTQLIDLLNKSRKAKICFSIEDLMDEHNMPCGTNVELKLTDIIEYKTT